MEESRQYGGSEILTCHGALQEAALAAAKQALENARERAPVRPSYGEFVFQSRQGFRRWHLSQACDCIAHSCCIKTVHAIVCG